MTSQILAQGAEAKIILDNSGKIIKHRIKKSYRIPELDKKIRERRTRAEAKLLTKASKIINCPLPKESKEKTKLNIPFIEGKKLSEHLDKFPLAKQKSILEQIGKDVAKLHRQNIIHGDLTTSNMILVSGSSVRQKQDNNFSSGGRGFRDEEGKKNTNLRTLPIIFFIDFGLGYFNGKYEDKAVDIHLLKQALEAKHFKNWKTLFREFEEGYKQKNPDAEKVFNQLNKVEKRGRYKH